MSQNQRISLHRAAELAEKIKEAVEATCERLTIAGSIRRQKDTVGDIEFVAVPKMTRGMFDVPAESLLEMQLDALVKRGRLERANKGKVNPKFYVPSLKKQGHLFTVEFYISNHYAWPVELAIRTGNADFSHKLVTRRELGGYLPDGCVIREGWQVFEGAERVVFNEEYEFLEFTVGRWLEPTQRGVIL
jgi:DNA polymerase/3'-5' exonuclease PolX